MPVYLVVAYAVFCTFTFVLVLAIWVRQRRIKRDLEMVEERLERAQLTDE